MKSDPKYGKLFIERPKFLYRKGKCLANNLVRADIQKNKLKSLLATTSQKDTYPCLNCANCSSIVKGANIHQPSKGTSYPVQGYYTCNSKAVIYLLKCPCGIGYVEQTSRQIKVRLNKHKSNIRLYKTRSHEIQLDKKKFGETSVARHFHEHKHAVSELKWQVIEQIEERSNCDLGTVLLKKNPFGSINLIR